jgi:guanine nucleotide-binding protein subunit beta-2-like 1 protein
MKKKIILTHSFKAHTGWITAISVPTKSGTNIFATGSRDCIIFIWEIISKENIFAIVRKRLTGHSHFISDLVFSSDAKYCISSSWDKTLNLWNLNNSKLIKKFKGHNKDILTVAFSENNRYIASGSRDNTIKLWNTLGECKGTFFEKQFPSWISCVKFLPLEKISILSCHWDGIIRIWEITSSQVKGKIHGHKGFINCAIVSPDGSLCASGGKDGFVRLWDLNEQKHLYSLEAGEIINSLSFSPDRYWLCASTQKGVKIWDLDSKNKVYELRLHKQKPDEYKKDRMCISMAWTNDCHFFLTGYIDGYLRVWSILKE